MPINAHAGTHRDAADKLVRRLSRNPNDAQAQQELYDLFLPAVRAKGFGECGFSCLIDASPKALALRLVAVRLCRAVDERRERLAHLEALYRHGVRDRDFSSEYAAMLHYNGQYGRCLDVCGEGLARYPDAAQLHRVRAAVHSVRGNHGEALEGYGRVLALKPGDPQALAMRGMIRLLISDGCDGWDEYDAGVRDRSLRRHGLTIPIPEWRGEPIQGKRLLLWCNEGVGDIVMFAGFLPWALGQGAQITLAVYPKLFALFARSFPGISLIPYTLEEPQKAQHLFTSLENQCDVQLAMSQLPARGAAHYMPAQHPPYLKADPAHVAHLRQKYRVLSARPKKLVGISWHTANQDTGSKRNIPLAAWRPLLELPDVQYVSLQYDGRHVEIEAVNRDIPGVVYADGEVDGFGRMDALAAQVMAMDEVVSIQNSTVHLAGALGVKTTLLLSAASEWRWGLQRSDSRWYRSVQVERQEKLMEWTPVLARVRERLEREAVHG